VTLPRLGRVGANDGFTIVEFAVALVIFVIGILGVSGLLLTVIHANRSASNRTRADQLLYEKVEEFQSTPFAAIEGGADQTPVGDVVFTRTWTVTNDVPVENVATIEIATEWSERDETFTVQTATMRGRD
jgi:prepilin-type N-terminal cleavage/methylation domain-containing protein